MGETLQNLIKNSHLINNLIEINKIKKDETQKEISIICDNISIYDLEEIHNKSNKDFIIKYYFYNANKELLDFYITNRITPYNLKLIDIKDKNSDKFFMIFNNDKFIILNKDTKIDNLKEIKTF